MLTATTQSHLADPPFAPTPECILAIVRELAVVGLVLEQCAPSVNSCTQLVELMVEVVEEVHKKQGLKAATNFAADLVAATTNVTTICSADIETDDYQKSVTELAGGGSKTA